MLKKCISVLLCAALTAGSVLPAAAAGASTGSMPDGALSSPVVELGSYYTKEMNYFAKGDSRIPTDGWVTNASAAVGLKLLPFNIGDELSQRYSIGGDVSISLLDGDGVYWVAMNTEGGTGKGLMRVDFSEPNTDDIFQYFFGPRYIYNANSPATSTITGLRSDGEHGIWIRNSEGAVHIRMVERTLREKADVNDQINDKLATFRGTIIDTMVKPYDKGNDNSDGAPGTETALAAGYPTEWQTITEPDGTVRKFQQIEKYGYNNDSYWTGLSLIGAANEYDALRRSTDPEDQTAAEAARTRIVNGTMNTMLLSKLHGTGDGFVMRNYKFTDEPGGGVSGKITYKLTKAGSNSDVTRVEIGDRFTVQKLGNVSGFWGGAEVKYFPSDGYFGDGLPNFAMGAETASAPDSGIDVITGQTMSSPGYVLLGDVYSNTTNGKKKPEIEEARANVKVYTPYVQWNTPVYKDGPDGEPVLQPNREEGHDWAFSYVVTEDVWDKYPELVEKLSVADPNQPTRPGYDGPEDMTGLTYYTDTSSEEPTGQYASYFALYQYVIKPELADPNTPAARRAEDERMLELLRDAAATTMNHIIDNGYVLMDPCGHQTTWGKWNRDYFNVDCDSATPGIQNHVFLPDTTLNSAEAFMFTRVALELLEDVKDDTTTSTGINIVNGSTMLVEGTGGYATYKSAYEKLEAEYAKMKQPLEPDEDMAEFTPITPNDPKNGVGYLDLMQGFNERQKVMMQFWMDEIEAVLADLEENNGVISTKAAQTHYLAHEYYGEDASSMVENAAFLKELLSDYQDAYNNNVYTITGNFSDALMYFVTYYPLAILTRDESDVYPKLVNAFSQIYDGQLAPQQIPFDAYLMKLMDPNHTGIDEDVASATWQLARTPQYLMNYSGQQTYNSVYRQDYFQYTCWDWYEGDVDGASSVVFPLDERRNSKFNSNILIVDDAGAEDLTAKFKSGKNTTNYDGNVYMYDPSPYNVGYWLGINFNIIQETK